MHVKCACAYRNCCRPLTMQWDFEGSVYWDELADRCGETSRAAGFQGAARFWGNTVYYSCKLLRVKILHMGIWEANISWDNLHRTLKQSYYRRVQNTKKRRYFYGGLSNFKIHETFFFPLETFHASYTVKRVIRACHGLSASDIKLIMASVWLVNLVWLFLLIQHAQGFWHGGCAPTKFLRLF